MNSLNYPVLVMAGCVAVLSFGLFQWMSRFLDTERKRLLQRLSGEARLTSSDHQPFIKAIIRDVDVPGFSGKLASIPVLYVVHRKLGQIWPKFTLATFLILCLSLGFVAFVISWAFAGSTLISAAVGGLVGAMPY